MLIGRRVCGCLASNSAYGCIKHSLKCVLKNRIGSVSLPVPSRVFDSHLPQFLNATSLRRMPPIIGCMPILPEL